MGLILAWNKLKRMPRSTTKKTNKQTKKKASGAVGVARRRRSQRSTVKKMPFESDVDGVADVSGIRDTVTNSARSTVMLFIRLIPDSG